MGRDLDQHPGLKRQRRTNMTFSFKSPFSSLTLVGIIVSIAAKFIGVEISSGEANTVVDSIKELWPLLLGLGADLSAAWYRLRASNFNKGLLESRTFWAAIASGVLTMIGTFGYDVTGFEAVLQKGMDTGPALVSLSGVLLAIFGRWKAKQKIAV